MAIALKVFPLIGVSFLLLLLTPSIESNDPFGFIQKLEGCHKGKRVQGVHDLKLYLAKYGYLDHHQVMKKNAENDGAGDEFDEALESAIKTYQQMYGLDVTGRVDANTANQMMKPRCGVADNAVKSSIGNKHKLIHSFGRYDIPAGRARWPSSNPNLHYYIRQDFQVPGTEDIKSIIARAFRTWTAVLGPYTFTQVPTSSGAQVEVGFHGKTGLRAGDAPFDGPGGVLAHATIQPTGTLHLDKDEVWSSNPGPTEIDLETIALHEIGHVLGLGHSNVTTAIMFPFFGFGEIKRVLDSDDIQGIRDLYELFHRP